MIGMEKKTVYDYYDTNAIDVPNSETIDAIKEIADMMSGKIYTRKYTDTDELFEDLDL